MTVNITRSFGQAESSDHACPKCGHGMKAVSVVLGFVKVDTYHCGKCGRACRHTNIIGSVPRAEVLSYFEKLKEQHAVSLSETHKVVLGHLERVLQSTVSGKVTVKKSLNARRHDHWEREFVKKALGDDYYS